MGKVKTLLEDLSNVEPQKRIEAITNLGYALYNDPCARDSFYKYEGKSIIIKRLFTEEKRKFVEAALFVLANSTINHIQNQNSLIDECVFDLLKTIIKQPNIMELRNFSHGAIYLISTIVYQNSAGQHLVRESGCLKNLLLLFHKILTISWKTENPEKELKKLDIICHTLYLSVNNPKNIINQNKVAVLFPKTLIYLSFLIFDKKMTKDCILPCLRLFTGTLSGNKATQEIFIDSGGMIFVKRLIMDKRYILEDESIEMCIMLMDLLIASTRLHSSELPSPSIITFLVDILQNNMCKLVTLLLLFHLMENDTKMQEVFIKSNGPEKMMQVCLKEADNEELKLISTGIWTMILKDDLRSYICPRSLKMDAGLQKDADERICQRPKKHFRMDSPESSENSITNIFDMTKVLDKRVLRAHKVKNKNTDFQDSHNASCSVSPLRKNIKFGNKMEKNAGQFSKQYPVASFKENTECKLESPNVDVSGRKKDKSDDISATYLSSKVSGIRGIKRKLKSPYLKLTSDKITKKGSDDIQAISIICVDTIEKGLHQHVESISKSALDEKDKAGDIQAKYLSSEGSVTGGIKRKLESLYLKSDNDERIRFGSDAIHATATTCFDIAEVGPNGHTESLCEKSNISERENIRDGILQIESPSFRSNVTTGFKRKLEVPYDGLKLVEEMKCKRNEQQISPASNITFSSIESKIVAHGLELDERIRGASLKSESSVSTLTGLHDLKVTPDRRNQYSPNRSNYKPQSGHRSETSSVYNIPLLVTSDAGVINVGIFKTPNGFQINLHKNRNEGFLNTLNRGKSLAYEPQISQMRKICSGSNSHCTLQGEDIKKIDNIKEINECEIHTFTNNSELTEVSKSGENCMESEYVMEEENPVIIKEQEVELNDNNKNQYILSSECTINEENEHLPRTQKYQNIEMKEDEVENYNLNLINLGQEMNTNIECSNISKHKAENDMSERLSEIKEGSENCQFQNREEDNKSNKMSTEFVPGIRNNVKKELLNPRGQRKRRRANKGHEPQIHLTRQEIANLNAGIKEYGLNFIKNKKMIRLSSDDSYSSED